MTEDVHVSDEPHNRLSRMGGAATEAIAAHPECQDGDKAIVFINDPEFAGMTLVGYDDMAEAIADLFVHLRALFAANGQELSLVGLDRPIGRDQ